MLKYPKISLYCYRKNKKYYIIYEVKKLVMFSPSVYN